MKNADDFINDLRQEAQALLELKKPENEDRILRLDKTGNIICRMRNALRWIATNKGGMPSHVAQDALLDCGYCAHFNFEVLDDSQVEREHPARLYHCCDCEKLETERFESWE